MDSIDRRLVSALAENARVPLKQLSRQVFLSPPAVSARVERLEQSGVITGYHADVDLDKLGYHILAFVLLAMSPDQKAGFSAFAKGCPNVLECHHISGSYSMLLKVCFPGTPELDEFVGALQQFGTTQTQIVFSTLVRPRRDLWAAEE